MSVAWDPRFVSAGNEAVFVLISRPAQSISPWRHRPSHFGSFSIDDPEGYFSPFCLLCPLLFLAVTH
jgi:hypothetical protein